MFWKARPISKLAMTPAPARTDRQGIAIILIVRNEARHIAEWARFHLTAGVRHFYVYDNGSVDGTADVLRKTVPADQLTIHPWDQKLFDGRSGAEIHNQVIAYAHATRNYGPMYRWFAFIDSDEFMVPVAADDLNAALAPLDAYPLISLPWHMFGRNGQDAIPKGGVLQNYTAMADPLKGRYGRNWKCLADPSRITALRVHSFDIEGKGQSVNDAGRLMAHKDRAKPESYSRAAIQLNHYYTRSNAELQAKIKRGSNKVIRHDTHLKRVMRIVNEIETNTTEDRTAMDYVARIGRNG